MSMKYGTALMLSRLGLKLTRPEWGDNPEYISGIEPTVIVRDGGIIPSWCRHGLPDSYLSYDDFNANNWEIHGALNFEKACKLIRSHELEMYRQKGMGIVRLDRSDLDADDWDIGETDGSQ